MAYCSGLINLERSPQGLNENSLISIENVGRHIFIQITNYRY